MVLGCSFTSWFLKSAPQVSFVYTENILLKTLLHEIWREFIDICLCQVLKSPTTHFSTYCVPSSRFFLKATGSHTKAMQVSHTTLLVSFLIFQTPFYAATLSVLRNYQCQVYGKFAIFIHTGRALTELFGQYHPGKVFFFIWLAK